MSGPPRQEAFDRLRLEFEAACLKLQEAEYRHRVMLFRAAFEDARATHGIGQGAPLRDLEAALILATDCEALRKRLREIVLKVNALGLPIEPPPG